MGSTPHYRVVYVTIIPVDSQHGANLMDSEKCKYVATADAMRLGERRLYSPILLRAAFGDRRTIDGARHATPEAAFLASLIGGLDGHYSLSEDRRGYLLSRDAQPDWHRTGW